MNPFSALRTIRAMRCSPPSGLNPSGEALAARPDPSGRSCEAKHIMFRNITCLRAGMAAFAALVLLTFAPAAEAYTPAAPQNLTATVSDGEVTLSWSKSWIRNGANRDAANNWWLDRYQVRYRKGASFPDGGGWQNIAGSTFRTTAHTVTGLENGADYVFQIRRAYDVYLSWGWSYTRQYGPSSGLATATPGGPALAFDAGAAIADRSYTQGVAIEALVLPEATGGAGTLSYALTPALPAGLSLDMATRTVSGTPTATQAATSYSWTVTDAGGDTASLSFTIEVLAQPLTFGNASVADLDWYFKRFVSYLSEWDEQLPAATGGVGAVTYALTPALPDGFAFTASDRRIKGWGTARSADGGSIRPFKTYTLTATDEAGQQASLTFKLRFEYLAPAIPTNLAAQAGDGQVTLSWDDPDDPWMTDYQLRYRKGTSLGDRGGWATIAGSSGATTSHIVTGLDNGAGYAFQIRAIRRNAGGFTNSSASETATATPNAVPGAPTGLAAVGGNGGLALSWALPTNTSDIEKLQLRWKASSALPFTASDAWTDLAGDATGYRLTGLTNEVAYSVELRAANGLGAGPAATVSGTPQNLAPSFGSATVADVIFTQGVAITAFALPEATGGDGLRSYALTPTLPAGLALDMATRTVSGTPTAVQPATSYSWTVTDADGDAASLGFTIRVAAPGDIPSFSTATLPELRCLVSYFCERTLPEAIGGTGTITYSLTPDLPARVTFDATTRQISGTARSPDFFDTYTYKAVDEDGDEAVLTFDLDIGYTRPDTVRDIVAEAGDGQVTLSWSDPSDRHLSYYEIRWAQGASLGENDAWSRIANSNGATTSHAVTGLDNGVGHVFQLRAVAIAQAAIPERPSLPSDRIMATPNAVPGAPTGLAALGGNGGLALSWALPTNTADIEKLQLRWKATSALPFTASDAWTDLAGDATGYRLTGLTNEVAYSVELRAANGLGAGPAATVAGTPQDLAPSFGQATVADRSFAIDEAITAFALPEATGGDGLRSYALTPTLPAGLALDMATRTVSGTPTALQAATSYSWTVTDSDGDSASLGFMLAVEPDAAPSFGSAAVADLTLTQGVAMTALTLPEATGGNGALSYALTPDLPDGLALDAATRTVSGTPTALLTATNYSWTVTDADGDAATLVFAIAVEANVSPSFGAATIANRDYELLYAIAPLSLPQASGGNGTLAYGLSPDLPAGLALDAATQTVSGTPTAAQAATSYSWTATDADGDTAALTFTIAATYGRPLQPAGLAAEAYDGRVTLSWSDPGDGNIAGYRLRYKQGTTFADSDAWSDIAGSGAATVSHDVTGLQNDNRYVFQIRAVASSGESPPSDIVTTVPNPRPAKPAGLRASVGNAQVTLAWSDPSDATITRYELRHTSAASFGPGDAWSAIPGSGAATVGREVAGLVNDVARRFQIRAVNAVGPGPASDEVAATPRDLAPSFGSRTFPRLEYSLNRPLTSVSGEPLSITLPRASGGDGALTYSFTPELPAGLIFDAATRQVSGAPTVTQDWTAHTVKATDADGDSATGIFNIRVQNYQGPPPPTDFTATPGDGRITLSWQHVVDDNLQGYFVFYGKERLGDSVILVGVVTSHTVTGLDNGEQYVFQIQQKLNGFSQTSSRRITATPGAAPGQPGGFAAAAGDGRVRLSWNAIATASRWDYRQQAGGGAFGAWRPIPGSGGASTGHLVTGLANGTAYGFQIRAVTDDTVTALSGTVTATPAAGPPGAVTSLAATASTGAVGLTWSLPTDTDDIDKLQVRWKQSSALPFTASDAWTDLAADATRAQATGLTDGVAYTFAVRAVNGEGAGDAATVAATPASRAPAAPTGLVATAGLGAVTLAWDDPLDPTVTGYELRYTDAASFGANDAWSAISGSGSTTAGHRVTGLDIRTVWRFQLRAVNGSGQGASAEASVALRDLTPSFGAATIADRTYTQGVAIAALALPAATGGDGAAVYALTPALPTGLALDMATRTVSGTPTAAQAATSYSWTATDADGDTVSLGFTIEVVAGAGGSAERQAFAKSLASLAAKTLGEARATIGQRLTAAPGASSLTVAGRRIEFGAASAPTEFDRRVSWEELRRNSAFEMAFGEAGSGLEMTAWGRGGLTSFRAEGAKIAHESRMETGWLGMDARMGDGLLMGFAMSRSTGETEASDGAGFTTALSAAWPYAQLKLASGAEVWTMLGAGNGSVDYRPAEGAGEREALEMRLASAGGRQPLADVGALGLALEADAGFVTLETGGSARSVIGGHEVQVWRARASLEAEHEGWGLGGGALAPFGSLAWRGDGGDWREGSGVEAGFGARLSAPGSRFALEAEGRHLALSSEAGYGGTGASLTAGLEAASDGAGLSWSISLATGVRADGAAMLADDLDYDEAGFGADEDRMALELEARYGFRLPAAHGLLSPLLRLSEEEGVRRKLEAGLAFQAAKGRVDLELTGGHEARNGADNDYRLRLDLRLGF